MSRKFIAVLGIAAAVALTGCSGDPGTPGTSGPSGPSSTGSVTPGAPTTSPGQTTSPALPSTAAAPTPGGTTKTVHNPRESTRPPVRMSQTSRIENHATAEITKIEAINIEARMPGEVSGPGLAITLKVTNIGDAPFDTTRTLMTITGSDKAPGGEMSGPPSQPMKTEIKPGESTTGVFVFTIPKDKRSQVTVLVTLPSETPVMVFEGPAPQ